MIMPCIWPVYHYIVKNLNLVDIFKNFIPSKNLIDYIIYTNIEIANNQFKELLNQINFKFKKFENEKIRIIDKYMKREYINVLSDVCCVYFVEKSTQEKLLISVFNSLFKGKDMRETIFLDMIKW